MQASEVNKGINKELKQIAEDWQSSGSIGEGKSAETIPYELNAGLYGTVDAKTLRMLEIHTNQSYESSWQRRKTQWMFLTWFIQTRFKERTKRVFDLILCALALPFVAPILGLTALAIKIDSPGPALFKQERVGKWGKKFTCYKFRSMVINADALKKELMAKNEADGVVFKMKKDPRVTRVGRIIRKLSIDELPQIFNVIKGDMSLVGPRPPVPIEVEQYQFDHLRRLDAIPGLTGLQQVTGRAGITFSRWVELDVKYIEEQSLRKDIEIILKTIPAVLFGKDAY
jgi:lipopolysaccharide/colanic/teichoic acid biosynthesis glycosyltransferase